MDIPAWQDTNGAATKAEVPEATVSDGGLEPVVVGEWGPENPWPGIATEPYLTTMSIAYNPATGEVSLDGTFRGGPEGRMLLELATEQLDGAFPKR